VLYEHPAVYEAAVFGIPHERLGEELVAALVLRPGTSVSEDDIKAHVKEHLASFKVPSRVEFSEQQLPRSATGKILKRELRDDLVKQAGA
jgi:long-chain acyl-CoA synthetase